jgi:hypothetical protein
MSSQITEFFHVAPAGKLAAGPTPLLYRPPNLPDEQLAVVDSLFPDGVTHWGEAMLTNVSGAIVLGPDVLIQLGMARTAASGDGREVFARG